jgi:hypothetical protein
LETRQAKHEPRSLAEQRASWHAEAATVLGGRDAVTDMVAEALSPWPAARETVDAAWVSQRADRVLAAMEERRSTWQMWHVRAEVQRHIRTTDIPAERSDALVDLLVDEVLHTRSVLLAPPDDRIEEPEGLRRVDGSSVYTIAGADLYSSRRILDAEQRLVTTAGRHDGAIIDQTAVDLALLEMAVNATALDAGQTSLVRQMCTSGARLQLAIAPAGAGKTTAMRALTLAWTQDGGHVVGLAPSAAAAAVLGEQTGIRSDTLAKLTWSVQRGELPEWTTQIGPSTLVIIDESGMADTVSLDIAVQFVIGRGGSVRLIGDDQQLAAIGTGGVLREIKHTHGALLSPSCTASPTPPKPRPPSPSATATPSRSSSISTTEGSMSATSPSPRRTRSTPGPPTGPLGSTRSCWPPPASSSPTSTAGPVPTDLMGLRRDVKFGWRTGTRPVSGT